MADNCLKATMRPFSRAAVYTHASGAVSQITGVFDQPHQVLDGQGEVRIDSIQPSFGIRLEDLAEEPADRDQIEISGRAYRINSVQEDGQGGAKLILSLKD